MIRTLEILYVGGRHPEAVQEVVARGAQVQTAASVYQGIARLKRGRPGAAVVEYEELQPDPARAMAELRSAAETRPVLVSLTPEEWDAVRGRGIFEQEEILLRPFYPDELWRRITRTALPAPAAAAAGLRGSADRLAALWEDSQRLNRFTNQLPELAEQVVAIAAARARAARVSLFLRSRGTDEMSIVHASGLDEAAREKASLRLGEGIAGALAASRRVTLVRKAGADGPGSRRDYRQDSYMIVPIAHQGEVLGVLCVSERYEEGPFTPEDAAYMQAFADTAAQVLHNALAYRAADELATIDELTQLFNRRHFNRVLPQEVERASRYKHDLTLAMIDVDYFKRYNDSMGHQAGDRALATIARILRESFRKTDFVVRYGGEEFAVIMPETSRREGNGIQVVDRARQRVEEAGLLFEDRDGRSVRLTISGGVATYPLQADSWETLVKRADDALYRAKGGGRNRIIGA